MTPNCANTTSDTDKCRQEMPLQGKEICDSRKLKTLVLIFKTKKIVLFKKYTSLKTTGLEKVPYSKRCCSSLNQLIKYSVFLV